MKKSKATEALRVATDIAAIKAALHKRGYRLRILKQMMPSIPFEIVFDVVPDNPDD
jgi:hypothetical protein